MEYITYTVDERRSAVEQLMTRYLDDVLNYAFSLLRNMNSAEDVAQEVFLKVYQNLHTLKSKTSVKSWLLAITRNAVKDHRKSAFVRRVLPMEEIVLAETSPSAETEALNRLSAAEIWHIVLSIPEKLREVIVLYSHHGLSPDEIANVLGISVKAVYARLHRARLQIDKALKGRNEHVQRASHPNMGI